MHWAQSWGLSGALTVQKECGRQHETDRFHRQQDKCWCLDAKTEHFCLKRGALWGCFLSGSTRLSSWWNVSKLLFQNNSRWMSRLTLVQYSYFCDKAPEVHCLLFLHSCHIFFPFFFFFSALQSPQLRPRKFRERKPQRQWSREEEKFQVDRPTGRLRNRWKSFNALILGLQGWLFHKESHCRIAYIVS